MVPEISLANPLEQSLNDKYDRGVNLVVKLDLGLCKTAFAFHHHKIFWAVSQNIKCAYDVHYDINEYNRT